MNAAAFAWRGLVRQPARAALGILGVAAVGALLFDMLLLSRGLVISMEDLLERDGFSARVSTGTVGPLGGGPPIHDVTRTAAALAALPEVSEVIPVRVEDAEIARPGRRPLPVALVGAVAGRHQPWTLVEGRDLDDASPRNTLISPRLAERLQLGPGQDLIVQPSCGAGTSALPSVTWRIAGLARFPFETTYQFSAAIGLEDLAAACGEAGGDEADVLMVAASDGTAPDILQGAIEQLLPELTVVTNAQAVARLQQAGFSYFRQISTVLTTVTFAFALLLIAVLLTVSVNQRLGTVAALRAIGFSQRRVIADVLWESALIVGLGGLVSLPLGLVLARGLDWILRWMPGLPSDLHFFVFHQRALYLHAAMLVATALLAAAYPMRIVARLPIAATLRDEVVS